MGQKFQKFGLFGLGKIVPKYSFQFSLDVKIAAEWINLGSFFSAIWVNNILGVLFVCQSSIFGKFDSIGNAYDFILLGF